MTERLLQITRRTLKALTDWLLLFFKTCLHQFRRGPLLLKRDRVYYIPLWLPIALALLLASVSVWDDVGRMVGRGWQMIQGSAKTEMAPFFAPSVQYWSAQIDAWALAHDVDRDLLATVMQIESCGHPDVVSPAGAQGLFQVMPFHFSDGENMIDPDTNARRSAKFLKYCTDAADGVIGLALACYNGGPALISQARQHWSHETQNYYRWGVGIYSDASAGHAKSETLELWLGAGGSRLCASALEVLPDPLP